MKAGISRPRRIIMSYKLGVQENCVARDKELARDLMHDRQ